MSLLLDLSSPEKEGILQVSKSRKLPLLIAAEEMKSLFEVMHSFHLFDVSRPVSLEEAEISKGDFLSHYEKYVCGIRERNLIEEAPLRPYFSSVISAVPDVLYAYPLSNGKYLIKPRRPVIQIQRHHFIYSDGFHSGVMGEESVTWGIQFSYPQLFLDPKTNAIGKVEKNEDFPNTALFQKLAKWVRDHTLATPFCVEGKRINQPMRLGKHCFSWINHHPKLRERGLCVEPTKNPSKTH